MNSNRNVKKIRRIRKARVLGALCLASMLMACGLSQLGNDSLPLSRSDSHLTDSNDNDSSQTGFESARRDLLITQPLLRAPGQTSSEAIARLGMPTRQSTERTSNPHDPNQQDKWIELEYPELRLGYYRNALTGQELLSYVRVSGERYSLKQELKVGDSLERFAEIIGPLDEIQTGRWQACDRFGRGDCLSLRVDGTKVVEIEQLKMLD